MTMHLNDRLNHMLNLAEQRYGPCNHARTLLPVEFHNGVPQVFYPTPTHIRVCIGNECAADLVRACYQLAHEVVHLLSPVAKEEVTVLEEGLATSFAHSYLKEHVGTEYPHSGEARYDAARETVEAFLAPRPDAVRWLREHQTVISRIDSSQIRQLYSEVTDAQAQELSRRFHNGHAAS